MDRTSHRLGGIALLLGALCGFVGGLLHGPQPGTLEAYAQLGAGWTASHVGIALAGTLLVVAAVFLARRFGGTSTEGWGLVGTGMLLVAGVSLLAVGTLETVGFSALLGASEGGSAVAAEHGFLATTAVMTSLATAGGYLLAAAVAFYGVAMLGSEDWPGWLGWAGVVIGAAAPVLDLTGVTVPGAPNLVLYLLTAWLAVFAVALMRGGRTAPAGDAPATGGPAVGEPARPGV